jgi:uncharacterized membrane protein
VRLLHFPLVVALFAAYFAFVFQLESGTWLSSGLHDWIDPYFINGLLEHWYVSLTTFSDPISPPMFHPARGTLGYSHGLILFAPFYAAIRPFLDPFPAHTFTLYLVMLTGAVCLYHLFRRIGLGAVEGLILSAFFATSQNVVSDGTFVWSQRVSVFLIPPILLLAHIALRSDRALARVMAGGTAGLLSTLLLTQDFYTGAFAWLAVGVTLIAWISIEGHLGRFVAAWARFVYSVAKTFRELAYPERTLDRALLAIAALSTVWAVIVAIHPIERTNLGPVRFSSRDPWPAIYVAMATAGWYSARRWRWRKRVRRAAPAVGRGRTGVLFQRRPPTAIVAFSCGAAIGLVLFFVVYTASFLEYRDLAAEQVWGHLVQPALEGSSPRRVIDELMRYESGRSFVLVVVLAGVLWLPRLEAPRPIRIGALVVLAWSLFVFLTPLRFDSFSLWKATAGWLPGMAGVRDPMRIVYVHELVVSVLVAALLVGLPRQSTKRLALAALVLALIAVEWNTTRFQFKRPVSTFRDWVEAPIAIDPSCRSFFVKGGSDTYMSRSDHMWSLYGVDALFIALRHGIPTLNGYTAYGPFDWDLGNPQHSDYEEKVRIWIEKYRLDRVCALDIDARTMQLYR